MLVALKPMLKNLKLHIEKVTENGAVTEKKTNNILSCEEADKICRWHLNLQKNP